MYKKINPALFAVIILISISGYALFMKPLIGLADNGDFFRIMISNDLNHEIERNKNDYFGYFNHKYDKLQYYNYEKNKVKSTQSIVIRGAILLDDIFTHDKKFDIRFLALICLATLALSIYWFTEVTEKMIVNKKIKYMAAAVIVFIFGDIGYVAYFNSFFGEAVAYPFYLLSIAALLKFVQSEKNKFLYLIIFFIASLMFIGSKNQFSLNGLLSAALLFSLVFFRVARPQKILAAFLGMTLIAATILMYAVIDDNIYLINKYHMITRGVMLFEKDVEDVTEAVGLNRQYALLSETIYFDKTPVIKPNDELLINDFYSRYSLATVTMYYLKNPEAFMKIMKLGLKNSFSIRPEILGNYERSSGKEYGKRTMLFALWSSFKEYKMPHSSGIILIFTFITSVFSMMRILKNKNRKDKRDISYYVEVIILYVFFTGLSQILVSMIGAGDTDLKEHLFMTTVSLDVLFYYNFVYGVSLLQVSRTPVILKEGDHSWQKRLELKNQKELMQ